MQRFIPREVLTREMSRLEAVYSEFEKFGGTNIWLRVSAIKSKNICGSSGI